MIDMPTQPRRPSFRDHSTFWTTAALLATVAIMVAGIGLMAFGPTAAALILLTEITVALAAGMR